MINSPLYREPVDQYDEVLPPIWLWYICTDLKNNWINVELLDAVAWKVHLKDTVSYIVDWGFTHVWLNVFSTNCELVKEIITSVPKYVEFIIWGAFTKTNYSEILKWQSQWKITVVVWEADTIVSDIVSWNVSQSPYIEYLENKAYIIDKTSEYFPNNISDLEIDRKFFEYEPTISAQNWKKEWNISVSRGCVYDCAFCSAAVSLNKWTKVRIRNQESVIWEIQWIIDLHNDIQSIRVLDDLFLRNEKSIIRAIEIFNKFDVTWRAMAHIKSFSKIEDELLSQLKDSWCSELSIWIESWNSDILKTINKVNKPEEVIETIWNILKAWIWVKWYFIFWFPWETEEQFENTYQLAMELKELSIKYETLFRISVFQFRPYHGTKLYNDLIESWIKIDSIWANQDFWDKSMWEFDFWNWNFSWTDYDTLKSYIIKTRELNE